MTLNSFHFQRHAEEVVKVFPDLKNFMYLESSGRPRHTHVFIFYLLTVLLKKDVQTILTEIDCITIKDVLLSYTLIFDSPNSIHTDLNKYKQLEKDTHMLMGQNLRLDIEMCI